MWFNACYNIFILCSIKIVNPTGHICMGDCNNLIGHNRLHKDCWTLIKSLEPQRTWTNSFWAWNPLMSHFVPVSSASLVYFSKIHAAARVTSGACTRSCNPWKIINTRSLRLLSFSLPVDSIWFAPSKKRACSVRLVRNKWSCGTARRAFPI